MLFWVGGVLHAAAGYAQSPQKEVTRQQLAWFSYALTLKLHPKWSLTSEIHERRFLNPGRQHQFVLRSQARYALGENWEAAAGFTYFLQSPHDPSATQRLVVPELRPHIQFNYSQAIGRAGITHRYRTEMRFFRNTSSGELAAGYHHNFRFRYRLGLEYRLANLQERPLKLKLSNELHVNAGRNITYNRFDQNRIYTGLSYALMPNLEVEAGYLNWYQQRASGHQFYNRHIVQLAVSHKLDLTGKRKNATEQETR